MLSNPVSRFAVFATCLAVSAAAVADHSIDINLNDDSARLRYVQESDGRDNARVRLDGSALYSEDEDTDDSVALLAAGLQVSGDAGAAPHKLSASIGGRMYWLHAEQEIGSDIDGFALGLGGEFRFSLAQLDRLAVAGHVFFAPDVLAFADVDQLLDYAVRVEYQVLRPASIYVGYRQVKVKESGGPNGTVDNGAHIGFRIEF